MPLKAIVNGVEKGAERMEVTVGNAQKRVVRVEAWNGSAWKVAQSFAPPISLSASPSSLNAVANSASVVAVVSDPTTAIVTGGTPPYTYLWAQTEGPAASIYSPTNATTRFAMALGPGSAESAQFRCTVTDKNGLTAQALVFATFSNTSGA
jgi:hypothetical protein